MNKKFLLPFVFLIFLLASTFAQAADPTVQVIAPVSGTYSVGSAITIDLNMSDADTNSDHLVVDVNYSVVQTQGTGQVILEDVNLSSIFTCTTTMYDPFAYDINGWNMDVNSDTNTGIRCTYSWVTTGVPAACEMLGGNSSSTKCDYYINVNVTDVYGAGATFAAGATTVRLTTGGDVNVSLTNFQTAINNSTTLVDLVMGGVAGQGNLIGLAIGIALAVGLLFGIVFSILNVAPRLVERMRQIK